MKLRKLIIPAVLLLAAFFVYKKCSGPEGAGGPGQMGQMPPAEVDVQAATEQEITLWSEFSGRLEAADSIELRPRISGQVQQVHFKDGDMVKKGDVLFTIDPAPFLALLKRAEGARAGARAQEALAETELDRAEKLYDAKAISKQEYDSRRAAAKANSASLKSASAEAELANLSLSYSKVRAPISGKVGRAEVTKGNMVAEGQTILTTLVAVSPIYASFEVDENTYLRTSAADAKSAVQLGLSNNEGFPYEGKILGYDNQISPVSGTIRARAIFENKDGSLIPGLFAKIRIGSSAPQKVILLDQKAIGTDQDRKFVYVAKADNTAEYRVITLGAEYEGKRIITSGLNAGDKVVVNGVQKIMMPGAPLKPNDGGAAKAVMTPEAPKQPAQKTMEVKPEVKAMPSAEEPKIELPSIPEPVEKPKLKLPKIENVPAKLKEVEPQNNNKKK